MSKNLALDIYYDLYDFFDSLEPIVIGIAQGLVIAGKRADKSRIKDDLENLNLEKYQHYLENMQKMQDEELIEFKHISLMRFDGILGIMKGADEVVEQTKDNLTEIQRRQALGDLRKMANYIENISKKLETKARKKVMKNNTKKMYKKFKDSEGSLF